MKSFNKVLTGMEQAVTEAQWRAGAETVDT